MGIHPVEVEYVKENIVRENIKWHTLCTIFLMLAVVVTLYKGRTSSSSIGQSLPRKESLGSSKDHHGEVMGNRNSTLST